MNGLKLLIFNIFVVWGIYNMGFFLLYISIKNIKFDIDYY